MKLQQVKLIKYASCLALVFAGATYTVAHPPDGPHTCVSCTQIPKPNPPCALPLEARQ